MLTKKQKQVARSLFEGKLGVVEIMVEYKLSARVFERWLKSGEFKEELDRLSKLQEVETEITLQRFGTVAALKLAELLGSEKGDTARRAAVDLIDRCLKREGNERTADEPEVSEEKAKKMILALAEGFKK